MSRDGARYIVRVRRLISLVAGGAAAVSLLLAACGGNGGAGESGAASVAPASTALFVSIDTDFDGEQWRRAEELVRRFPGGRDALRSILRELESEDVDFERDVKPAIGSELVLVWLDLEDDDAVVLLTQPRDEAKLRELVAMADRPHVVEEIDGWFAVARSQRVLSALKEARAEGALSDSEAFEQATEDLPEDRLASVYVRGGALARVMLPADASAQERSLLDCVPGGDEGSPGAIAVTADEGGFGVTGAVPADDLERPDGGVWNNLDNLPGGAIVVAGAYGLGDRVRDLLRCVAGRDEEAARQIAQLELALGASVEEEIVPLFARETIVALYPNGRGDGVGPVDVTLVSEVESEEAALATVDRIARRASAFLGGVDVRELTDEDREDLHAIRRVSRDGEPLLHYTADLESLVITTDGNASVLEEFGVAETRVSTTPAYKEAREAADAPDEPAGLLYADLSGAGQLFLDALEPSGAGDATQGLERLKSLFVWSDVDDDGVTFRGFLRID